MSRIALLLLALVIASLAHGTELSDDELKFGDDDIEELRILANQGNVGAQTVLSHGYGLGIYSLSQDLKEAFKWGRLAAEQGDLWAQTAVGNMYFKGLGVAQDYKESVKWYRKAADKGSAEAQLQLGHLYFWGYGVTEDYKEAVKWWRLASEQGDATAQTKLGAAYLRGQGVIEDKVYAHMWWNIAASQGVERARKVKDQLAKRMSTQDISKAQELARQCVKQNYKDC